jgi:hypothetical protein
MLYFGLMGYVCVVEKGGKFAQQCGRAWNLR